MQCPGGALIILGFDELCAFEGSPFASIFWSIISIFFLTTRYPKIRYDYRFQDKEDASKWHRISSL